MTAEEAARAAAQAEAYATAAETAHAAAQAAGLELLRADNTTGFRNVSRNNSKTKPYHASVAGKRLGPFFTAEEAALAVARKLGPKGIAKVKTAEAAQSAAPTMTVAEAVAAAAAEGLELLRADNQTGFRNVSCNSTKPKPYQATVAGTSLGDFATAEEAALAVARKLGQGGHREDEGRGGRGCRADDDGGRGGGGGGGGGPRAAARRQQGPASTSSSTSGSRSARSSR